MTRSIAAKKKRRACGNSKTRVTKPKIEYKSLKKRNAKKRRQT